MARKKFFIVGGLENPFDDGALLEALKVRSGQDVEWRCAQATSPVFDVESKRLYGLLSDIGIAKKEEEAQGITLKVIMLRRLNKKIQNKVFAVFRDPVLAPDFITLEELVEWIFLPTTGLFPPREWLGNCKEAALMALTDKLLRNKRVAGGPGNHVYLNEADLLGQSPVDQPAHPEIRREARVLLEKLKGKLFLTKGTEQGTTPKEWAVNTAFLPGLKRAVIQCSIQELEAYPAVKAVVQEIRADENWVYHLDEIVSERTINFCRDNRGSQKE